MIKRKVLSFLLVFVFFMLFSYGQTTVYCPPTADAVIGSLSPSINFGASTYLLLGYDNVNIFPSSNPIGYGRIFIKYNLSSIPAGATITSAKIRLKFAGSINAYVFTMSCFRVDQSWTESTITWSNKPSNITEVASASYPTSNYSSFYLDITSLAQEWYSGSRTNNGVMLMKGDVATNMAVEYISKEHSWYPTNTQYHCLEVVYTVPVSNYTVSGRVTSSRWPYGGINGIKVDSDSGQTATTDWNGDYALYNVPQGSRIFTAYHPNYDYWATPGSNTASQSISLAGNRNDINFSQFACKGTAQASISVSKTTVHPGETFNVTVTLTNVNTALANVASYLDVSFPSEKFTVGTPTASVGSWTNLTTFPPGSTIYHWDSSGNQSTMTSYEYLISGERLNNFGFNSNYSYTFPLTVKSDASAGIVTLKYRGTIGDERDPDSTGSGTLDQQGLNVKTLDISVVPLQLTLNIYDSQWRIIKGNSFTFSGQVVDSQNNPIPNVPIHVENPILMQSIQEIAYTDQNGEFNYVINTDFSTISKNYTFIFFAGWEGNCFNAVTIAVTYPNEFPVVMNDYELMLGVKGETPLSANDKLLSQRINNSEYVPKSSIDERTNAANNFLYSTLTFAEDYFKAISTSPGFYVKAGIAVGACVFSAGVACPVALGVLTVEMAHTAAVVSAHNIVSNLAVPTEEKDKLHLAIDSGDFLWSVYNFSPDGSFFNTAGEIGSISRSAYNVINDVDGIYKKITLTGSNESLTQGFALWKIKPNTPVPISPSDEAVINTLTPEFTWSSYQDGGDGESQAGYQLKVINATDGDILIYNTGFISDTNNHSHIYSPGLYSGLEPISDEIRISETLEWGKHYQWSVRYRDSGGDWSS